MENSLKALTLSLSVFVFALGMTMLLFMQNSFDASYEKLMEVVSGGYIW